MYLSPTITLDHVTKCFAAKRALEHFTATIHPGEFIAVPLGLLRASNLTPHPVLYHAARRILDLFRAVNEFVFALMFVTAVGLGPFAGMLALGIHTGGVFGKLLSDPNSTFGYLVPMTFFLTEMGIEPKEYFSKLRVIWVSKLVPNDPIVVRTDLPIASSRPFSNRSPA